MRAHPGARRAADGRNAASRGPGAHLRNARGGVVRRRSREADANAIAHHYDVSNEFYALFLDPLMVYTCAYYRDPDGKLEQAQQDKLDHVCRKLELRAGETLRSEEHTSELQSQSNLVCRLLLEKKKV